MKKVTLLFFVLLISTFAFSDEKYRFGEERPDSLKTPGTRLGPAIPDTGDRNCWKSGNSYGSWGETANWSKGTLPDTGDVVVFGGDCSGGGSTIMVGDVPDATIDGLWVEGREGAGGTWTGTYVYLMGATDGTNLTIRHTGRGGARDQVYIEALPVTSGYEVPNTLDLTTGNRVNLVMNPGTKLRIDGKYIGYSRNNSTPGHLKVNVYETCEENNLHPGLILKADATKHAEMIQDIYANDAIKGFVEFQIIPSSSTIGMNIAHYVSSPVETTSEISNLGEHCRQENCLCVFDQWPFVPGDGDWVRFFDVASNSWGPYSGNDDCSDPNLNFDNIPGHIAIGRGINIFSYFQNKLFFGLMNNAPEDRAGISLPTAGITDNGFALTGNPFPSGLNFDKGQGSSIPGWTWGANIKKIIYYWDPALAGGAGDYRYFNWEYYTKVPPSTHEYIPRGQGFFVQDDGDVNGTDHQLIVNNDARVFAVDDNIKSEPVINNQLSLALYNVDDNYTANFMAVLFLNDGASLNYCRHDASKFFNDLIPCQMYGMTADDHSVSQKSFPTTSGTTTLAVHVRVLKGGNYRIDASQIETFGQGAGILLFDRKTNTTVDLRSNPAYSFTTVEGDNPHRFDILFSNVLYGIEEANTSQYKVYSSGKTVYVQNSDPQNKKAILTMYDMLGRQLLQEDLKPGILNSFETNFGNSGCFIVTVRGERSFCTQKVFIR